MADNKTTTTTVSTIPSGTIIATDEIGGVDYQRVKLACGPDGTATDVPVGGGVEAAALRVTIATDSTGVLSIDDNGSTVSIDDGGGIITVDGTVAVTSANLTTIAGAVSGTEMQVDVVAALPAGTNAIGKLAANSGVDIGDVDVTTCGTITPGTAAANLGKAEDAAHTTGDVGVMALTVRQNTAAALSGTDADYQPLITDTNGRLHVIASAGVAGDVAHDAADSGSPVKIGAQARTTNPTAVADADRVNVTADDLGRQVVVLNQVRDLVASQLTTISNSTSETTIVTAAASTFHDLTHLTITNATATAVTATLRDVTAGSAVGIYAIAANGGITLAFPVPKKQATVNTAWTLQLSALSITVYVVAEYCKNV